MDVIVTHESADFDAIASLIATRRLYEGSVAIRPATLDRSVRDYVWLHATELALHDAASLSLDSIDRLVVVDTADLTRLGRFSAIVEDVEVVVFDHHGAALAGGEGDVAVASSDGALTTTLIGILNERDVEITSAEATLFALAIHQDTGSLTYQSATARDVEALAYCYRRGADLAAVERYTRVPLGPKERAVLQLALAGAETITIDGVEVQLAPAVCNEYSDGAAQIVDKLAELLEARALVCLLEHDGKTSCIIRSRGTVLHAARLATALGGGGHRHAAAAVLKCDLAAARAQVIDALPSAMMHAGDAGSIMSSPARFVPADTTIREAMVICRRARIGGLLVGRAGDLKGIVSREDLDGAIAHDLAHAPVKAVMSPGPLAVAVTDTVAELQQRLARPGVDRVAVERDGEIVGVVTRRDLLRHESGSDGVELEQTSSPGTRVAVDQLSGMPPIIDALDALGGLHGRAFLVGGAVRDTLLGAQVTDIDLAVEGPGIPFAKALAERLQGRATPYGDFGTATVTVEDASIDVATTRSEFYAEPGALPTVEDASIEGDLFRRDFTMNAMAVALDTDRRGELVDPFGGADDLRRGVLRVLHNLSFVDDPTRLVRAARYESRYGFRLDLGSESLARSCVGLGLVGALSGARVGNELVLLLREEAGFDGIRRLADLGVLAAIHGELDGSLSAIETVKRAEGFNQELRAGGVVWRLRMAVLTRGLASSERYLWLEKLQLARRDIDVVSQAAALPATLATRAGALATPQDLYGLLVDKPAEAIVLALAEAEPGSASDTQLRHFLNELRHVRLTINGEHLAELGLAESPGVGRVLDAVLAMKLEGTVSTSEEELAAARRLIDNGEHR